ncbi:putative nuclease HARBI1 [Hydra vulgaris]|uniref:putative nuclease HARBI1 n=1 Tax=Hydra vulgaris TaxID=6087 RepID=UPI0002B45D6F|nr:putative nuclease HARBI1 [Hydra vulgaris]
MIIDQAVCDYNEKFIDVAAKGPGSTHDARILRESNLGEEIIDGTLKGLLFGNSRYPCFRWLLTPYLSPTTTAQCRYNISLKRTRVLIEQVFGCWKRRFHLLHGKVRMTPERTCTIIAACAVLQNLAIELNDMDIDDNPIENYENNNEDIVAENNFRFCDNFVLRHFGQ